MTSLTDTQVITASGGLVELGVSTYAFDVAATTGTGTAVGFNLSVVCDGSPVLVQFSTCLAQHFANVSTMIVLYMDGSAVGTLANYYSGTYEEGPIEVSRRLTPSAGAHTFEIRVVSGGGGTNGGIYANNGSGTNRVPHMLRVSKIVQATQWPAVTTATIVCTSTTRPASPNEGQQIWEADTDRTYIWSGSAWLQVRQTNDTLTTSLLSGTVANANLPDGAPTWYTFGRVGFPTGVSQAANLAFTVPYKSEVFIQASVSGYGGPGLARQYMAIYGTTNWEEASFYYFNYAGDHRTLNTGGILRTLNAGSHTVGTYILNINTDSNDQASYFIFGRKVT